MWNEDEGRADRGADTDDGADARRALEVVAGASTLTGFALSYGEGEFRIDILDGAGDVFLSLGPYSDEEVVATWRALAATSGLPLLVAGPDGRPEPVYPQIGRIVLGTRTDRRRLAVLSGRRPRFLVKRKTARLPRRPIVYREAEIASGRR